MSSTAVVLVNYDTESLLLRCLDSLRQHLDSELLFIVVDNSPAPDTSTLIQRYPEVEVLRPGTNLGFAGGCNLGLEAALERGADAILLLNPDTVAEDDFLEPLLDVLDEHPDIAVVSPRIHEAGTRTIWYGGGRMHWWLGGPKQVTRETGADTEHWREVPFVSGCAMLLRAEAVRLVGPLDERYFLYFEDADYVQRLLGAGFRAAYAPCGSLLHGVSGSIDRMSPSHAYFYARGRVLFMRRWARWYHFGVFALFTALVKIPAALVLFGVLRQRPGQARAFVKGCVDGFRGTRGLSEVPP